MTEIRQDLQNIFRLFFDNLPKNGEGENHLLYYYFLCEYMLPSIAFLSSSSLLLSSLHFLPLSLALSLRPFFFRLLFYHPNKHQGFQVCLSALRDITLVDGSLTTVLLACLSSIFYSCSLSAQVSWCYAVILYGFRRQQQWGMLACGSMNINELCISI